MTEAHLLCDNCAVGIENADDSVWEDLTPDERAAVDATIEAMGLGTISLGIDQGYYRCYVCSQVAIGETHLFTTN